jgi:hypothetical protein
MPNSPIASQCRPTDHLLSTFGLTDRPSLLPSPTIFWVLSHQPTKLKQLPQPTIFWALSG